LARIEIAKLANFRAMNLAGHARDERKGFDTVHLKEADTYGTREQRRRHKNPEKAAQSHHGPRIAKAIRTVMIHALSCSTV